MSGLLISIEGGEGAGKTTVQDVLKARLEQRGATVVLTREPGGTPAGEAIRKLLLDAAQALTPEAELLLMFAARTQLLETIVEPALASGKVVLTDRFTDASFAYQGGGRGLPMLRIAALERMFVRRRPDFTLLLDLDVGAGLARASARGLPADRIEREALEFFERVRAVYRNRAASEPARIALIDAAQEADQVVRTACVALDGFLNARAAANPAVAGFSAPGAAAEPR